MGSQCCVPRSCPYRNENVQFLVRPCRTPLVLSQRHGHTRQCNVAVYKYATSCLTVVAMSTSTLHHINACQSRTISLPWSRNKFKFIIVIKMMRCGSRFQAFFLFFVLDASDQLENVCKETLRPTYGTMYPHLHAATTLSLDR